MTREIADRLGWASTYDAEYIALTQLQADAFVTLDAKLRRSVEGIVTTASMAGSTVTSIPSVATNGWSPIGAATIGVSVPSARSS